MLWNDIEWPDAGKRGGPYSLHALFEDYYAAVPEGVVNDRWGDTHRDFRTSEYEANREIEDSGPWENCRGIGFSFGYNQAEDETQSLDALGLAKHLTDVVSRGGRLLLNVGPTEDGRIPDVQRRALEGLGRWMATAAPILRASARVPAEVAAPGDEPWVRWLATPEHLVAVVADQGRVELRCDVAGVDVDAAEMLTGGGRLDTTGGRLVVEGTDLAGGPGLVRLPRR